MGFPAQPARIEASNRMGDKAMSFIVIPIDSNEDRGTTRE